MYGDANFVCRVAISTTSSFDLIQALNSGKIAPVRETAAASRIGFVFTGQGAQYYNMGRELYSQYPIYAATIDTCDSYLASLGAPFSLLGKFYCSYNLENSPNAI
jgi:acyl transferase domain-containing protein